jgi:hypothetical protein
MAEPESILQLGIEAARDGNKEEARNLFRLLTRQEPRNTQAWLWLAGVAESREERQAALEHVIELEPNNDMAIKGLQALGVRVPSGSVVSVPAVPPPAPTPVTPSAPDRYADFDDDDPFAELDALSDVMADGPAAARRDPPPEAIANGDSDFDDLPPPAPSTRTTTTRTTTTSTTPRTSISSRNRTTVYDDDVVVKPARRPNPFFVFGIGLVLALSLIGLFAYFSQNRGQQTVNRPPTTQVQPTSAGQAGLQPTTDPALGPTTDPLTPTTALEPTVSAEQPTAEPAPPQPAGDPAVAAIPAIVQPNTPLNSNGWTYNFSQPNYSTSIIGALNGNQPQGRFVVVLLLVNNGSGQPQTIPADFFVLKDSQGRVYNTLPNISSAYVIPGVNADLSQEQPIPADGGNYSVALLFDVAPDATNLVFFARSKPDQGWQVLSAV